MRRRGIDGNVFLNLELFPFLLKNSNYWASTSHACNRPLSLTLIEGKVWKQINAEGVICICPILEPFRDYEAFSRKQFFTDPTSTLPDTPAQKKIKKYLPFRNVHLAEECHNCQVLWFESDMTWFRKQWSCTEWLCLRITRRNFVCQPMPNMKALSLHP